VNSLISNRILSICILFLFSIYIISRVLFLDGDVPPWNISYYQPIDELYYSLGAFNLYQYGDYDIKLLDFLAEPKYTTNYFTEILVFISLKLFGNNYYGLRISSVFAGIMIIFLVYQILKDYLNKEKKEYGILLLVLLYMIIDFSFLISTRIVEPTIFRLLAFMIIFYITIKITKRDISNKNSFILGFLAFVSVFYVYTTNLFILPAIGIFIFLSFVFEDYKKGFQYVLVYILGVVISFLVFLGLYSIYFESNYFQDFMEIHSVVTSRVSNYFINFLHIFQTNIFRFNANLLFLTIISFPLYIYITFYKKRKLEILLFCFILMFFAQTFFINDYYYRKLIFIFPLVILMITITYFNRDLIFEKLLVNKVMKIVINIYIVLSFLITFVLIDSNIAVIGILNYITLIFSLVVVLAYVNKNINLKKLFIGIFIILFFVTNIILSYTYVYAYPTFKYKMTMMRLANIIDNQYTVGWSHAMRLYNKSIPLMSIYWYTHIEKENYEKHKNLLIKDKKIIYEFVLIDKNTKKVNKNLLEVFDINEVTGDTIGLIKYEN